MRQRGGVSTSEVKVGATKSVVASRPLPGIIARVPGYGQFCPIARASEIFAERWTPLVLREVIAGRHHFNEILKGLHSISPSVLGDRLRRLERSGILEALPNPTGRGSTYFLTPSGQELASVVRALGEWGMRWLSLEREHLDADFLMWRIFKHLRVDELPAQRRVARFDLKGEPKSYWLVLQRGDPDLCYSDPGFGDDIVVRADLETLVRVYLGELEFKKARSAGLVEIEGQRDLASALAKWFPQSGFAGAARRMRYDETTQAFVPVHAHRAEHVTT